MSYCKKRVVRIGLAITFLSVYPNLLLAGVANREPSKRDGMILVDKDYPFYEHLLELYSSAAEDVKTAGTHPASHCSDIHQDQGPVDLKAKLKKYVKDEKIRNLISTESPKRQIELLNAYVNKPSGISDNTFYVMNMYNLTLNTPLYRVIPASDLADFGEHQGLDRVKMKANPNSIAQEVLDYYDMAPNPIYEMLRKEMPHEDLSNFSKWTPVTKRAAELDAPSFNVAAKDPSAYAKKGVENKIIMVRLGDVLKANGQIYPDLGAAAQGMVPFIITVPSTVPGDQPSLDFEIVKPRHPRTNTGR